MLGITNKCIMLSVVMLSVVKLNVVKPNVVAPLLHLEVFPGACQKYFLNLLIYACAVVG